MKHLRSVQGKQYTRRKHVYHCPSVSSQVGDSQAEVHKHAAQALVRVARGVALVNTKSSKSNAKPIAAFDLLGPKTMPSGLTSIHDCTCKHFMHGAT